MSLEKQTLTVHGYLRLYGELPSVIVNVICLFYVRRYDDNIFIGILPNMDQTKTKIIQFDITSEFEPKILDININDGNYCYHNNYLYNIGDNGYNIMCSIDNGDIIELPPNNFRRPSPSVTHAKTHGLIVLGGCSTEYVNSCEILRYQENNKNNIKYCNKWDKLPDLSHKKAGLGCCSFERNGNEYIFECCGFGGKTYYNHGNIYDFDSNKWNKLPDICGPGRSVNGCGYDNKNSQIVIAGGYPTKKRVDIYRFDKNIWYNINDTQYNHLFNPLVYIDDNGLIYICGNKRGNTNRNLKEIFGYIEMYDPRDNSKKWVNVGDILALMGVGDTVVDSEYTIKTFFKKI